MKKLLCVVFDSVTQVYGTPMTFRTSEEAKRSFIDAAMDENTQLHKHSEDFSMLHIADYDEDQAKIISLINPVTILNGRSLSGVVQMKNIKRDLNEDTQIPKEAI
jgi:hypothetical protein